MKSLVRGVREEKHTYYKVIVFYEVGLPRVYDIPSDENPKTFIRNVTKQLSVSISLLGWALIDPVEAKVIRSEGLSESMYKEMDRLLGVDLKREPKSVYLSDEEKVAKKISEAGPTPAFRVYSGETKVVMGE